jgi:hypothetical protein
MAVLVLAMNRYPPIFLNPLALESGTVPSQRRLIADDRYRRMLFSHKRTPENKHSFLLKTFKQRLRLTTGIISHRVPDAINFMSPFTRSSLIILPPFIGGSR